MRPRTSSPNKFKDPQIKWHQAYFDLADDEALVVEVTPPECEYWMIALHNHWMETLDYVHHQSTLNCHSASSKPTAASGSWSLTATRASRTGSTPPAIERGTVGVRWVGPDVVDVLPSTQVVKLASYT